MRGAASVMLIAACCAPLAYARAGGDAGAPTVTAEVRPQNVTVGDVLTYVVRADAAHGGQIRVPAAGDTLGNFTVRSFDVSQRSRGGRPGLTARYKLAAFETGNVTIPAVRIEYKPAGAQGWSAVDVPERVVEVASVLGPDADAAEFDDEIAGPVAVHSALAWSIVAACALAVLAAVIFARRRRLREVAAAKVMSAHEIALKELEELQCRMLIANGEFKEYFVGISGIIRRYIENRFDLRAPEMTTEEFLESIRFSDMLKSEHTALLREFLGCCDLVKFAKYRPEEKEADAMYAAAYNLIAQTKEECQHAPPSQERRT